MSKEFKTSLEQVRKCFKNVVMGTYQKSTDFSLKGLLSKSEIIWASKYIIIVMDYNPFDKIKIHESILIYKDKEERRESSFL